MECILASSAGSRGRDTSLEEATGSEDSMDAQDKGGDEADRAPSRSMKSWPESTIVVGEARDVPTVEREDICGLGRATVERRAKQSTKRQNQRRKRGGNEGQGEKREVEGGGERRRKTYMLSSTHAPTSVKTISSTYKRRIRQPRESRRMNIEESAQLHRKPDCKRKLLKGFTLSTLLGLA